ncbi:MAG TPA: TetR/AcrR family transcriptional regulator [Cyclobacteriaceae bacterium]|jgi:AcrR family transcriptional regulator|nr:TetR/AcrR family transcriptional regulator [Cyclobacteriaceae bacterium]
MSPRNQLKNAEIRQETMRKISEAAFSLIVRQGFESTTIAQIAREARVSKGLLYNYYVSKEALLEKLILDAMSQGEEVIGTIFSEDPIVTMENLIKWFFKEMRERPDQWRLITEVTLKIDKYKFVHDIVVAKMQGYISLIQQLLTQMGFEDAEGEARLLAALFDGIGMQALVIREDYPLNELEKIMINKFCKRKHP